MTAQQQHAAAGAAAPRLMPTLDGVIMNQCIVLLICLSLLVGCTAPANRSTGGSEIKTLNILWQRLVDEQGQTCDRCGTTESAVEEAEKTLKRSLRELGIAVVLEKKTLNSSTFLKDPLESNRIWIGGKSIENWLSASSGQSKCCSSCGDSECRTMTVDGKTYEAIPAELIIKAGLLASAQLIQGDSHDICCPSAASSKKSAGCCPDSSETK